MPKRIFKGIVIKTKKSSNTAIVSVVKSFKHPSYKKIVKVFRSYVAHYEGVSFNAGDIVYIEECRPISKTKKWFVKGVV